LDSIALQYPFFSMQGVFGLCSPHGLYDIYQFWIVIPVRWMNNVRLQILTIICQYQYVLWIIELPGPIIYFSCHRIYWVLEFFIMFPPFLVSIQRKCASGRPALIFSRMF